MSRAPAARVRAGRTHCDGAARSSVRVQPMRFTSAEPGLCNSIQEERSQFSSRVPSASDPAATALPPFETRNSVMATCPAEADFVTLQPVPPNAFPAPSTMLWPEDHVKFTAPFAGWAKVKTYGPVVSPVTPVAAVPFTNKSFPSTPLTGSLKVTIAEVSAPATAPGAGLTSSISCPWTEVRTLPTVGASVSVRV